MLPKRWEPELNWETEAGKALMALVHVLPKGRTFVITVFGSAPLQIGLESSFVSADVDIFSDEDLSEIIAANHLGKGAAKIYIEFCSPSTFCASPDWSSRACTVTKENAMICFPHPIDILVAKLPRLEPKDLAAYRLVHGKLGIPTEDQLKEILMNAVDLFRPRFDEEQFKGDIFLNTKIVWQELYGKEIDVRAEIITPALKRRKETYEPKKNYKAKLATIGNRHQNTLSPPPID